MSLCPTCGQPAPPPRIAGLIDRGFDPLTHCVISAAHYGGIVPCEGLNIGRICHLCDKGRKLGTWTPANHGSSYTFTPKDKP